MTDKQKQSLLTYLGYYSSRPDGIWGPLSRQAEARFREDYALTSEDLAAALLDAVNGRIEPEDFWSRVEFFKKEEFRCRCGGAYCDGFPAQPDRCLVTLADRVRKHFGAPAHLSSGIRCPIHNARVGGVSASRHLTGKAMDFRVSGRTAAEVLEFVQAQPECRYAYSIDGTYVHMDVT